MNKPLHHLVAAATILAAVIIISCNKKMSATAASKEAAHTNLVAAGKTIYTGKCTRCHEAKPVANWNAEQWKPILKSMIKKTRLDSLESAQVTAYVNEYCKK